MDSADETQIDADMLDNFCELAYITPQQQWLYDKAKIELGLEAALSTRILDSQKQFYSLWCNLEQFRKYGPGAYLLLKFLKYISIVLGFCSLIALANMVILISDKSQHRDDSYKLILARTTIAFLSSEKYNIVIALDFLIFLAITIALICWKQLEVTFIIKCCTEALLPSYSTVILTKIPENYHEFEMKAFLEKQYGQIREIFTMKDFGGNLDRYKDLTKIVYKFKEERALIKLQEEKIESIRLTKLFFSFENKYRKLYNTQQTIQLYKPTFAFIQFKSVESRQKLLKDYMIAYPMMNICFKKNYNLYYDQKLEFQECNLQPDGIIWQNLNLSKYNVWLRMFGQILFMSFLLFISVILVFSFTIVQSSLVDPAYVHLSKQQIIQLKNPKATKAYCLGLFIDRFVQEKELCETFEKSYVNVILLLVFLPITISLLRFIMTQVMKAMANFRRYPNQISRIKSQLLITFIFYFIITALLEIALSIQFHVNESRVSVVGLMLPILKAIFNFVEIEQINLLYPDFNSQWYIDVAPRIILVGLVTFGVSAIGKVLYHLIKTKLFYYLALKQKIQIRMNQWLEGDYFQVEYIYAVVLNILFFTFLFAGSMPILLIAGFISMVTWYWATKIIFIKYCKKPLFFSHSINSLIISTTFIGIVLHCIITPIFFGVPQIAKSEGQNNIFMRMLRGSYYFLIIAIIVIYNFLGDGIKYTIKIVKQKIQKITQDQISRRHRYSLPTKIVQYGKQAKHQHSYSMHQNDEFKNILKTLYTVQPNERRRSTFIMHGKLQQFLLNIKRAQNAKHQLIDHMLKLVKKDSREFKKKQGNKSHKSKTIDVNPYDSHCQKLKKIYHKSKHSMSRKGNSKKHSTINFPGTDEIYEQDNQNNNRRKTSRFDRVIEDNSSNSYSEQVYEYPPTTTQRLAVSENNSDNKQVVSQ